MFIWRFPKIGVSLNHPFVGIFPNKNHPFGAPWLWKPPWVRISTVPHCSHKNEMPFTCRGLGPGTRGAQVVCSWIWGLCRCPQMEVYPQSSSIDGIFHDIYGTHHIILPLSPKKTTFCPPTNGSFATASWKSSNPLQPGIASSKKSGGDGFTDQTHRSLEHDGKMIIFWVDLRGFTWEKTDNFSIAVGVYPRGYHSCFLMFKVGGTNLHRSVDT